jgi:hypothetical protein
MDSDSADKEPLVPAPKTGAERVRKYRKRRQQLDVQVAYGIAKLVTGRGVGEQKGALLSALERVAATKGLPDDIVSTLDEAIDKLKSRSLY